MNEDGSAAGFRVASYNVRKAIGRDARRDPERILDLVARLKADVVALQEADYRFMGRQAIFDPTGIVARTGLAPVDLPNGDPGLGWHGNVLLAGERVTVERTRTLDLPGLEPRGGVLSDLVIEGRPLRVVCAHLGLLASYRRRQSTEILAAAALSDERATLVMGDFNGWGRSPPSLKLFTSEMRLAPTGRSYPSRVPVTPLDRIYYDGPVRLEECGTLRNRDAGIASDHLPIWARFAFEVTEATGSAASR